MVVNRRVIRYIEMIQENEICFNPSKVLPGLSNIFYGGEMKEKKNRRKALILILSLLLTGILVLSGCSSPQGKYEKMIMEYAEVSGISGGMPIRYSEEDGIYRYRVFNMSVFTIMEFNTVKVIKFGPITGVPGEDFNSESLSEGIFEDISENSRLSIFDESQGPNNELIATDLTAILAEVSIARIYEAIENFGDFGLEIQINEEYLNETTRVWFLGYTKHPQNAGEEGNYIFKVVCFEDLDYFDSLIEVLNKNQETGLPGAWNLI